MSQSSTDRKIRVAFVTGANGFIGSHLCMELCSSGVQVRALVRNAAAAGALKEGGVQLVEGDIREPASFSGSLANVDTVFHCAALAHGGGYPPSVFEAVNVTGTRHLIDACRRQTSVERIVHVSTVSVFGNIRRGQVASEELEPQPRGIYGITKLAAEQVARQAPLPTVVARPMWVYGWRSPGFVKLLQLVLRGRMVLIDAGRNAIQPIAIEDLVQGLILCATVTRAAGEIYTLAGPSRITTARMCKVIAAALGAAPPRFNVPLPVAAAAAHLCERLYPRALGKPPIDMEKLSFFTTEHAYSIEKARQHLAWSPRTDFEQGVAAVTASLEQQGLLSLGHA